MTCNIERGDLLDILEHRSPSNGKDFADIPGLRVTVVKLP